MARFGFELSALVGARRARTKDFDGLRGCAFPSKTQGRPSAGFEAQSAPEVFAKDTTGVEFDGAAAGIQYARFDRTVLGSVENDLRGFGRFFENR